MTNIIPMLNLVRKNDILKNILGWHSLQRFLWAKLFSRCRFLTFLMYFSILAKVLGGKWSLDVSWVVPRREKHLFPLRHLCSSVRRDVQKAANEDLGVVPSSKSHRSCCFLHVRLSPILLCCILRCFFLSSVLCGVLGLRENLYHELSDRAKKLDLAGPLTGWNLSRTLVSRRLWRSLEHAGWYFPLDEGWILVLEEARRVSCCLVELGKKWEEYLWLA